MIKLLFSTLLFLSVVFMANASWIDKYFDYGETSTVDYLNLNGNLNNIINTVNGNLDNTNLASGYRLFELLGSIPAAGTQGRIVFNTTSNALNFDTGATWYDVVGYLGTLVQGDIIYHDGSSWKSLTKGTSEQFLMTGNSPSWQTMDGTKINISGQASGDILYFNGTDWARLAAGTSGQILETRDVGSAPVWKSHGYQLFTSSGTFTASPAVVKVYLTMTGGGGTGGDGINGNYGGGGGCSGAYIIKYPYTVVAGNSYTVTINGAGGTSVFDTITCPAGTNGINRYAGTRVSSVNPGMFDPGYDGGEGGGAGGKGGGGPFGNGGAGGSSGNGSVGTGYGAGGGGGGAAGGSFTGAAGTGGMVLVEW